MGLASALSTALTGLTAAETQIDVVGNNLANSQTVGFKESEVAFTTQFLQTIGLGAAPTATSGGTNPRQIGLGTQVAEVSPKFTQGTIKTSASATDVALQGDGFFIVEGPSSEQLYTRAGVFRTNSDSELVTVNGNRLLGYTVDDQFQLQTAQLSPLSVPVGSIQVAQETENVFLEGSLPPIGGVADTAGVLDTAPLGTASIPRPDSAASTSNSAGVPNEAAVTPVQSEGPGSLAEGAVYRYRFAFVDGSGTESTVSDELSLTVPVGNSLDDNVITLNNLPDSGGEYPLVNVYRTAANGAQFFLLSENQTPAGTLVDDGNTPLDTNRPLDQSVISGNYSYLVTFAAGGQPESRPSQVIGPVNVVDGRVHLENLPQPPVPGPGDTFPAYDRVRIYRNLSADPGSYYLVDEIAPGQDYTDNQTDATIVANGQIDLDGPTVNTNTLLTDILKRDGLDFQQVFQEGTLELAARKGGRALDTDSFDVTASSTVQDLLDFIRESTGIQGVSADPTDPLPGSMNMIAGESGTLTPGGSIAPDGQIRFVSNNGVDNAVTIDSLTLTTTAGEVLSPDLGFNTVQEATGQSTVADFLAFDSLGSPVNVRVTTVLEELSGNATTYRWFADSPDNAPTSGSGIAVGTGLVSFDGDGNLISVTNSQVAISRPNFPASSPLDFDLDFNGVSGLATDEASLAAVRQDGFSVGTLASFSIGEDGVIRGAFSNGISRTLGQIRLARFINGQGLEQQGRNMFAVGANSGLPIEGDPGQNGIGSLVAGAVELSNTDIGQNLIDLVLASTQYRGNTRVITTSQQLLEELLNLRR